MTEIAVTDEYRSLQENENSRSRGDSAWGALSEARVEAFYKGIYKDVFEDDTFADFGGNDGRSAQRFRDLSQCHVKVLDMSPSRLAVARENGLETLECELSKVPLPDESIDWGFCSHTLEHVLDLDKTLREMHRLIKRGIFFVIPLEDAELVKKSVAHVRYSPDPEWWAKQLEAAGFVVDKIGWDDLNGRTDCIIQAFKPEFYQVWKQGAQDVATLVEVRKFDVVIAFYRQYKLWHEVMDGLKANLACINNIYLVNDEPWIGEKPKSNDLPIIYLDHEHVGKGPSQSFNQGMAAASTEHVLLMEGDIVLPRGALLEDLPLIEGKCIVVRGVTRVDPQTGAVVQPDWRKDAARMLHTRNRPWPLMACNYTVVHREEFLRLGGFNEDLCSMHGENSYADEDREFAVRFIAANRVKALRMSPGESVIHLGGRREKAVPYVPMEARQLFVESLTKLFGRRYHLFCGNEQILDCINVNHLDRSDGMDVRLDCINMPWLLPYSADYIKVTPPLVYFSFNALGAFIYDLCHSLAPGGQLDFTLEDHPFITIEMVEKEFNESSSTKHKPTIIIQDRMIRVKA